MFYQKHFLEDAQISLQWGETIFTRKIGSFARKCFQNQLPRWLTCFTYTEEKTYKLMIVIFVENVLQKTLSRWCTNFATGLKMRKYSHSGAKTFLKGKLLVLWEIVSQTKFPNESHGFSHRRKALQTQKCDMCGKYFSKTTVLKMHKFCHSGAEPALRGKLRVQESHVIQRNKIK